LFLRNDQDYGFSGGAAAVAFGRATALAPRKPGFADMLRERWPDFELAPDLGSQLFTRTWFRGFVTCSALCALSWALGPRLNQPIYGYAPLPMQAAELDETRAQGIAPLALGAGSGRRMAATDLVSPLKDTPERPRLDLNFGVVAGNGFVGALQRSGVGKDEAQQVAAKIDDAIPLGELKSGAEADLTLGRRPEKSAPRPLDKLSFRARFDAFIDVTRVAGALVVRKIPIAIDNTPLRIEGEVGGSLYRSARALGAPAKAVEEFLRTIATRIPVSRMGAGAKFTLIADQRRAATGEVEIGKLRLAGLEQGRTSLQLMRWERAGKSQWLDSDGVGERKGALNAPVSGARLTSGFGMRIHPILGTARMHKGYDLAAPMGSPIHASMDGIVAMAGRAGGYGNFVKLNHAANIATGYGHMSRILVRPGQHVHRGDLIGLVGSTGLSTGPHLHYEVWKDGVSMNPGKMTFSTVERLAGADLQEFKAQFARLMTTPSKGGRGGK